MIETYCQCGSQLLIEMTECGQVIKCPACGQPVQAICAEAGIDGSGDFDACLIIQKGPTGQGRQVYLGGIVELTIGKQSDKSLSLPGNLVSRLHCRPKRVDFGPSRWIIEDNHSTNGLLINGQRVSSHELAENDAIYIGEYVLIYRLCEPKIEVPPPLPVQVEIPVPVIPTLMAVPGLPTPKFSLAQAERLAK